MKQKVSKKFAYPHPLVKPFSNHSCYSNNYQRQLPPYTYQPFESSAQSTSAPCPHIFRTSNYVLGNTVKANSNLELGCIVTPFGHCGREVRNYSKQEIGRCQNCSAVIKSDWVKQEQNSSKCLICMSNISSICQQRIKSNGNQATKNILIDKQHQYIRRILFIIQISGIISSSEIYEHIISNIQILKEREDETVEIGLLLFNQMVKVIFKGKGSFSVAVIGDSEQTTLPISPNQMFFSISQPLEEMFQILRQLTQVDENNNPKMGKFNQLNILEMVQAQVPANTEMILVMSNHKTHNQGKQKSDQLQKIKELSNKLLAKGIVVNLFYFLKDRKPLYDLERILQSTGGACNVYILNRQYFHEDFYYDLYHYLSQNHYYDVKIKVKCSQELICTRINHTVFQQKQQYRLSLSKLSQNSNFNIYLQPKTIQPTSKRALLNIQIFYKHRGHSKSRIINFEYPLNNQQSTIYSSFGDQCQFFLMLRKMLYQQSLSKTKSKPSTPFHQPLFALMQKLVKLSDFHFGGGKTFTIHSSLMFSVYYTQHLIRNIESTKTHHYLFKEPSYNWKHLSLERLSKMISMKLYRIDRIKQKQGSKIQATYPNIRYTYTNIQQDGIYALDNGKYIYVYVGDNVSPVIKEEFIAQKENGRSIDVVDERVSKFIEMLRVNNHSQYLQLRLIAEKDRKILEEGLYNEGKLVELVRRLAA